MTQVSTAKSQELRRGWRVLTAAAVGVTCGVTAVPIYTMGLFVKPLQDLHGWSRGEIQTCTFFAYMAVVVASPGVGMLVDRFGPRRLAIASVVGISLAVALIPVLASSLVGLYVGYTLVGLLGAGTAPVVWTRAVNEWFTAARGFALGVTLMGTGIFATFAPGLISYVIAARGWQAGYLALAAIPLCIVLPLVVLWFKERGVHEPAQAEVRSGVELGFKDAARTAPFWIIGISFLIFSTAVSGFIANYIPLLTGLGLSQQSAATAAGLIGIAVMVGRLTGGLLLDKFPAPRVAAAVMCLPAVGCGLIYLNGEASVALPAAVLVGLSAGAEFDLVAYMTAHYFGLRHYGRINGVLFAGVIAGGALGPMLFGFTFDAFGSYGPILAGATMAFICTAAAQLFIVRPVEFAPAAEGRL